VAQRFCLEHTDRPAIGLCHQCHKPICEECRYDEAPEGLFCSRECYDRHLAYHSRKPPEIKGSRLKSMAVGCLILLVVVAVLAALADRVLGIPILRWIRGLL